MMTFLLFPYIALISAFAAQMALLGFIFPLLYLSLHVRERGKKKEEEEKSPEKTTSP